MKHLTSYMLCICMMASGLFAQKQYLIVGSYDTLRVDFYDGDQWIGTASSGWFYPCQRELFIEGIRNAPLIAIPEGDDIRLQYHYGNKINYALSFSETMVITETKRMELIAQSLLYKGLMIGILGAMILYNLIIFLSGKDSAYFWYMLFLLFTLLAWLTMYGFMFRYVWPSFPAFNIHAPWVFIGLINCFAYKFTLEYLNVKALLPNFYRQAHLIYFVAILLCVVTLLLLPQQLLAISMASPLFFILMVAPCVHKAFQVRYTPVYHYTIAFLILAVTSGISIFAEIGLLPNNIHIQHLNLVGTSLLSIVFAIGLTERINLLKKKNLQQEQEVKIKAHEAVMKQQALEQRELLIKEIHHRAKNNLQMIYSLLNIQKRQVDNDRIEAVLTSSQNKIKTMSLIHEELYSSNKLGVTNARVFLMELINHLSGIYDFHGSIRTKIDPVNVPVKQAIPLGLVVNELLTNGFKHGFTRKSPEDEIEVELRQVDQEVNLSIQDNGVGMRLEHDEQEVCFGLSLVKDMIRQLKGTIRLKNGQGVGVIIQFPLGI